MEIIETVALTTLVVGALITILSLVPMSIFAIRWISNDSNRTFTRMARAMAGVIFGCGMMTVGIIVLLVVVLFRLI